MRRNCAVIGAILIVVLNAPARANPASDALRVRAFKAAYNLDHDRARTLFEQAIAADPGDPAAYRGLASIAWLNLVFRRGAVTVDHYLGGISKPNIDLKKPPGDLASLFHENAKRALALAEQRARANERDVEARYHVGAAVGLLASYTATVDGKLLGAFRAARRAYNEHEEVLRLDPQRKNAALIVGMYRYFVSAFSLPVRWMAHIAGFGGGKERRLYPRNRLLWLEAGATALRAGRAAEAERSLNEGIRRLPEDHRPRMLGEESLWYYKRGIARVALRNLQGARADLDRALDGEVQPWVRGRVHVELGRLADLAGDRARARAEYDRALAIFQTTNDPVGERDARRFRESRSGK